MEKITIRGNYLRFQGTYVPLFSRENKNKSIKQIVRIISIEPSFIPNFTNSDCWILKPVLKFLRVISKSSADRVFLSETSSGKM